MMDDVAISVDGVHKAFKLPHERSSSLKSSIIHLRKIRRGYENQHVLKGISFDIKKGEFFGIVGRNGSGKSTLLKLISQIYTPDKGKITVNGKLTPFIELGVGFNPELSGRDNVYLNGALLGFSSAEMDKMYHDIVNFAELGRFMDQKLKNYSSGMQVRLAFSIAIRANTEILVLDEVLAVGDEAFQRKCFEYFAKLKRDKKTVVLVTHDMHSVQRFCTRALLIENGEIMSIGSPADVVKDYQELNKPPEEPTDDDTDALKKKQKFATVKLYDRKQRSIKVVHGYEEFLNFDITLEPKITLSDFCVEFSISKDSGEKLYWYTTELERDFPSQLRSGSSMQVNIRLDNIFGEGGYRAGVVVRLKDKSQVFIKDDEALSFKVAGRGENGWMLHPNRKVDVVTR